MSDLTDDTTHRIVTDTEKATWNAKGSSNLALGETSSTAYRGDRGKTAYTHASDSGKTTTAASSGLYKIACTNQGHVASLTDVVKADITALGIPGSDTNTVACAYCDTAAGTAAKTAACTDYALLNKSWLIVTIKTSNTSKSALTLNVNEKGAKSIYINANPSSSTNYTLNAGTYFVYYESNIYYFRNDGKISLNAGGFVNNSLYIKNTTVDMTKTGNDLSSTLWTDYHFVDNNNKIGASVRPIYYYNATTGKGDVGLDLIARNWSVPGEGETSAQVASGGFRIVATKDGDISALLDNTHTATAVKNIIFTIGNNKATGTACSNDGVLRLYGKGAYYGQFYDSNNRLTANRTYQLPNASGIMALTSDISDALKWKNEKDVIEPGAPIQPGDDVVCPNTANEIKLHCKMLVSSSTGYIDLTMIVAVSDITATLNGGSTAQRFRTGYYQNGTNGGELSVFLWKSGSNICAEREYVLLNGNEPSFTLKSSYR